MNEHIALTLDSAVTAFHLPRYHELPDVGLYLEQVVRYVNRFIIMGEGSQITPSMVSNYVKQKIIPGPDKKSYGANSLAYLIFIAYTKTILPLDGIRLLEEIQRSSYDLPVAYNYFCDEFENLLQYVFGKGDKPALKGTRNAVQKQLLRSALLSISHKIYLDQCLRLLTSAEQKELPQKNA